MEKTKKVNKDVYIKLYPSGDLVQLYSKKQLNDIDSYYNDKLIKQNEINAQANKINQMRAAVKKNKDDETDELYSKEKLISNCRAMYQVTYKTKTDLIKFAPSELLKYFIKSILTYHKAMGDKECGELLGPTFMAKYDNDIEKMIHSTIKVLNYWKSRSKNNYKIFLKILSKEKNKELKKIVSDTLGIPIAPAIINF